MQTFLQYFLEILLQMLKISRKSLRSASTPLVTICWRGMTVWTRSEQPHVCKRLYTCLLFLISELIDKRSFIQSPGKQHRRRSSSFHSTSRRHVNSRRFTRWRTCHYSDCYRSRSHWCHLFSIYNARQRWDIIFKFIIPVVILYKAA